MLIGKQLVTIELANNISLKIRFGCSVTGLYLVHFTPLISSHHPLAATYSLQNVYSVKSERKGYLGRPKGAPSFQTSKRKMELLGSRRGHLLHLDLWRWEMGICIALFKVGTCLPISPIHAFKLQYVSHCRRIKAEAASCKCDTEEQRKVAAHLKAFNIVLDFIQCRVVGQNEVVTSRPRFQRLYICYWCQTLSEVNN